MKRLAAWFFAPVPAERLAALRIVIGAYACGYLLARVPELVSVTHRPRGSFDPIGVVSVLGSPLPSAVVIAIIGATIGLAIAFTLGVAFRITGPLAAAALLWTLTYRSSWGQPFHTENLLVLHVCALACSPAADAWAVRARPVRRPAGHGWPIKLMIALTIATYLLAGVAKLKLAGAAWLDGDQLRNQIAIDNLRKALLGERVAILAVPFLEHGWVFTGFSLATLAVELGAPVVIVALLIGGRLGRRVATLWAIAAWLFHVGVLLVMNILFPYALFGFAYLPLFELERPLGRLGRFARDPRRRNACGITSV